MTGICILQYVDRVSCNDS